jgi:hypothetical protein
MKLALLLLSLPFIAGAQDSLRSPYRIRGDTLWIESATATRRQIQRGDTIWLLFTKSNSPSIERRYVLYGTWAVTVVEGKESWVPAALMFTSRHDAERRLEVDSLLRAHVGPPD